MTNALYKASPIGDQSVPDLVISATEEIPEQTTKFQDMSHSEWRNEIRDFYDSQAEIIFSRIKESLPGGTVDALLRRLLKHKSSLLSVRDE